MYATVSIELKALSILVERVVTYDFINELYNERDMHQRFGSNDWGLKMSKGGVSVLYVKEGRMERIIWGT